MVIRITYLITVFVSLLLLLIGHQIAVVNLPNFHEDTNEVVRARVLRIVDQNEPGNDFEEFIPFQIRRITFEARVTRGERRGQIITATQGLGGFHGVIAREVSRNDSILLVNMHDTWFFTGYLRTNRLLVLGMLFTLCVLFFGGKKGFNTLLSLTLTLGAIFAVFIPSILSGKNIYLMAILVCLYTTFMTLLIVIGFNKKAFTAGVGCICGLAVTGLLTIIMDRVLFLTGVVDEHSRLLLTLPVENPINLRAIIFAGIIIGAMGAIMDVSISISSALWELKKEAKRVNFKSMFHSGLTIGRDIFGTMANTLILAYLGTSLSLVLILSVYSNSLLALLNSEMIVVEILKGLAGIFGILLAMPLTAMICSVSYTDKSPVR